MPRSSIARETRFCYLARNLACSVYWHVNGMPQLIINYRKMTRKWHANCKCQDARHQAMIWHIILHTITYAEICYIMLFLYYCIFWCIFTVFDAKKIQFSLKNCQSSKKYSIKWHPKRLPTYTMKVCQICAKLRYNGKKIPSFHMQNGTNLAFMLAFFVKPNSNIHILQAKQQNNFQAFACNFATIRMPKYMPFLCIFAMYFGIDGKKL